MAKIVRLCGSFD